MKNLLITVPHGFCPKSSTVRECDLRALSTAKIIGNEYKKYTGENYDLVYIPKKRALVDLNRKKPLGGSKIWDEFNKRIKKKLKPDTLLIDCHSFPIGDFERAQIAILDLTNTDRVEVEKFIKFAIRRTGLDIKFFKGRGNYIQDFYSEYSYPLLIEFCEDREYLATDQIKIFIKLVFDYFLDLHIFNS